MSKPLTPALQRWLEHVRAAEARGLTLEAYAAEQGLLVHQLYAGKAKDEEAVHVSRALQFTPTALPVT